LVEREWARKPIIILGAILQNVGYTGLLVFPISLKVMYLWYFLLGLGSVLSLCTSYNLMIEFSPNYSKITVSTLFLSL
jgi:cyanate permease